MRPLLLAAALLAACSRSAPPPPLPEPPAGAQSTWFICDGIDAPVVFVFEREGNIIRVAEYDKPNGAIVGRFEFAEGADDAAAGSIYTALLAEGMEAGAVRQTNPGMLETPGAAYTPRIAEVRIGERVVRCRWLPRTRLFGITGRRSLVISEDADGDLIYTTFDFANAAIVQPIDLTDNGVSTPFSVEVRGGEEMTGPGGATFKFRGDGGHEYIVTAARNGQGALEVMRNDVSIQSEPLIAFQAGEAASE